MCIGTMRFCLENAGKTHIEYVEKFSPISLKLRRRSWISSAKAFSETRFERRIFIFPVNMQKSGFHGFFFSGFWPSARFSTHSAKAF